MNVFDLSRAEALADIYVPESLKKTIRMVIDDRYDKKRGKIELVKGDL